MKRKPILEIGSGHNPMPYAEVLLDRYIDFDGERGGALKIDHRPILNGDIENLPFRDKAFSFVICRHVLEHVPNPGKALSELERVSDSGYIETPSPLSEFLEPHRTYHRWVISLNGSELQISPKNFPKHAFASVFSQLWKSNFSYRVFYAINPDIFLTRHFWKGHIKWQMITEPAPASECPDVLSVVPESIAAAVGKMVKWGFGKMIRMSHRLRGKSSVSCEELLACPICRKEYENDSDDIIKFKCGHRYRKQAGIPILLADMVL